MTDTFHFTNSKDDAEAQVPTEHVSFNYEKITWTYDKVEWVFDKIEWVFDDGGDDPREIKVTYSEGADAARDPLPTEEVTLGYTEVEWTY